MQEENEDFATENRKKKRTLIDTQSNNNYSVTIKFKDGTNNLLTKYPKVGYGCG